MVDLHQSNTENHAGGVQGRVILVVGRHAHRPKELFAALLGAKTGPSLAVAGYVHQELGSIAKTLLYVARQTGMHYVVQPAPSSNDLVELLPPPHQKIVRVGPSFGLACQETQTVSPESLDDWQSWGVDACIVPLARAGDLSKYDIELIATLRHAFADKVLGILPKHLATREYLADLKTQLGIKISVLPSEQGSSLDWGQDPDWEKLEQAISSLIVVSTTLREAGGSSADVQRLLLKAHEDLAKLNHSAELDTATRKAFTTQAQQSWGKVLGRARQGNHSCQVACGAVISGNLCSYISHTITDLLQAISLPQLRLKSLTKAKLSKEDLLELQQIFVNAPARAEINILLMEHAERLGDLEIALTLTQCQDPAIVRRSLQLIEHILQILEELGLEPSRDLMQSLQTLESLLKPVARWKSGSLTQKPGALGTESQALLERGEQAIQGAAQRIGKALIVALEKLYLQPAATPGSWNRERKALIEASGCWLRILGKYGMNLGGLKQSLAGLVAIADQTGELWAKQSLANVKRAKRQQAQVNKTWEGGVILGALGILIGTALLFVNPVIGILALPVSLVCFQVCAFRLEKHRTRSSWQKYYVTPRLPQASHTEATRVDEPAA